MIHLARQPLATGAGVALVLALLVLPSARAANFPLYVRYLPYTPPSLYLRTARATSAYYVPIASGNTFTFDLDPVFAGMMTFAEGPVPITLSFYPSAAGCAGNRSVTALLQYSIGGTFVNIGSETQALNISTAGPTVLTFSFNAITSAASHVLQATDFIRLSVTPTTGAVCLVNEFPLGGTDADASKVTLQTGPLLTVTKTSTVFNDPINGTTNPKRIPGATVRYSILVENDAQASASGDGVTVFDPIPAGTTYSSGSITLDTGAGAAPLGDAGNFTGTAVSVDTGAMAPGASATVTFDVTVD